MEVLFEGWCPNCETTWENVHMDNIFKNCTECNTLVEWAQQDDIDTQYDEHIKMRKLEKIEEE